MRTSSLPPARRRRLLRRGAALVLLSLLAATPAVAGTGGPSDSKPPDKPVVDKSDKGDKSPGDDQAKAEKIKEGKAKGTLKGPGDELTRVAAAHGLTLDQVKRGLIAAHDALDKGDLDAAVSAFAKATGTSRDTAAAVIKAAAARSERQAKDEGRKGPTPEDLAVALAKELNVNRDAALKAVAELTRLSDEARQAGGHLSPDSPGFAKVAHDLGVTTDQLAAATRAVKERLAGQ